MKRAAAIALLFVFLVNTMGYYIVFRYNEHRIRSEMLSQIRLGVFHPGIVILRIGEPDKDPLFRRMDKREFRYSGRLYDVILERRCNGITTFYCIHDRKEEDLVNNYTLFLRNTGRSGSPSGENPIPALLSNLVVQALIQEPLEIAPRQCTPVGYPESFFPLPSGHPHSFSHPPETA